MNHAHDKAVSEDIVRLEKEIDGYQTELFDAVKELKRRLSTTIESSAKILKMVGIAVPIAVIVVVTGTVVVRGLVRGKRSNVLSRRK
jgi:hypothetical protein